MNASQFADAIGIKPANLSHVLSGRNKPSMDFLEKVIEHFPRVNAAWLLTGIAREELSAESDPNQKVLKDTIAEKKDKEIDRIVIFYSDGTFKQYTSGFDHTAGD
jgi:transcriptional regulator with XRE-family HTH domain